MNDMLFRTLLKRYEALIEDSLYKIKSLNENILRITQKAKNIKTPNKMYFSNEICLSSASSEKVSDSKFLSIDL